MNFSNCLWFKFRCCPEIGVPCIKCKHKQPTPEEFNQIYLFHQERVQKEKENCKTYRRYNRKWKRWYNKYLGDLYVKRPTVRCFLINWQ